MTTSSSSSSSRFWSVSQAVAWVMYRRRDLVVHAETGSLGLISLYPTMFSPQPVRIARSQDLISALEAGDLTADGIRVGGNGAREKIPSSEWRNVRMSGDHLSWTSDENTVQARWTDILVERAAVERKWRGEDQKRDQTLHDWAEARRIFDQVSAEHPEYSKNKKIETTRDIYANGHRNRCPGVSSFKRQMKNWH